MFAGVLALLERSLRVDSRAWGPHLARFGLMAGIYVAVCYATATSAWFGAPGLRFFQCIVYLNLTFMTLLGIGFFATAITEEKEEDTLGLMLMAGISPLGILLGKSGGRLVQALLLIAVQYPFTLLAVTMGGVTQNQVRAIYSAMISYMVFLAGVGLLCSTLASRNRSASVRMAIAIVAYLNVPVFCMSVVKSPGVSHFFDSLISWVSDSSVVNQVHSILESGSQESWLSRQVITNIAMGGIGFVFSWVQFGWTAREPSSEASSRGFVTRNRGMIRVVSPGRPRIDPLVWKDFHFVAGGFSALLIRLALFTWLYILIVFCGGGLFSYGATGAYLTVLMFVITFDAGLLASRSLHEEVRGQTLASLMMLPKSTGMILYPKMVGSFLVWLVGPACLLFGMIALPDGQRCTSDFFRRPGPPYLFISFFVLLPHVAAVVAMYVRWGALPIGIGITIGLAFLTAVFISTLGIRPEDRIVFAIATAVLGLWCACHIAVWLRAEALSAR